jgi:hypothetical protein
MGADEKAFEGWAILELMGHRRLAGWVSEVTMFGHGFIRLDIPADGELPAATQFYSPSSLYALTPTTEETVRLIRSRPRPVEAWEARQHLGLVAGGEREGEPW